MRRGWIAGKNYSGGYLISNSAAARIEEIEEIEEIEDIPLSPREIKIIEMLNAESDKNDNCAEVC